MFERRFHSPAPEILVLPTNVMTYLLI